MIKKAIGHFAGGIFPEEFKSISSTQTIQGIELPERLTLALQQNIGHVSTPIVKVGDKVLENQLLAIANPQIGANIHAPTNGIIEAIGFFDTGHPSGLLEAAIILKTQAKNDFPENEPDNNDLRNNQIQDLNHTASWTTENRERLLDKINQAGIVGLGGATFPTHLKLSSKNIKILVVNAMECEPYITCDDRMLQEHADKVIEGALIAAYICGASEITFATEDNKPNAISSLEKALKQSRFSMKMSIIVAPTKYPSGGEKQLIELVLNKQLPQGKLPSSIGVLVQNVATLYAVYDAIINNRPLTKRLVTLTGDLISKPGNYWLPFGTPLSFIMDYFKVSTEDCENVIFGGPLMGQKITYLDTPVTKSTNCIIFNSNKNHSKKWLTESTEHTECIRCGECDKACPVSLLPQQLYWFSQGQQLESLEQQGIFDCIECGACAYVCPSEIPLVGYYRFGKSEIKNNRQKQAFSDHAKQRFEFREKRLQRLKNERALKHKKAADKRKKSAENSQQDPTGKQTAINQALERVKQKKANLDSINLSKDK